MRGADSQQTEVFSYIPIQKRIPQDHPLRPIRSMVDSVLKRLSPRFRELYSHTGRPSVPPERLLRALLQQILYTIRSERLLMEQLDYNLLFRWFVGLSMEEAVWDATVFTKNRDRLLAGEIAPAFFQEVLAEAGRRKLLSEEHFTVDGTLIEAWASQKSFQQIEEEPGDPPEEGGNPTVSFRGEQRSNRTHRSQTDPESRLFKKSRGAEAKLSYLGHVVMENRNGLAVSSCVSQATGTAEREAALQMRSELPKRRITLGADRNYDVREFTRRLRACGVTPHVTQHQAGRSSSIDGRTTRHAGYRHRQRKRKRIEEIFGWLKTVGVMRKTRHRGIDRVQWMFQLAVATYNLVRIRNLTMAAP